MPYDVFISYSTKDKLISDAICAALEADKIRCWVAPRDILPGETWQESIINAIGKCKVMVLVFSSNSNNSRDVSKELSLAVQAGAVIVPFRIENVQPRGALKYYLSDTHWLDAMNPPTEGEIKRLVETVGIFLRDEPVSKVKELAASGDYLNYEKIKRPMSGVKRFLSARNVFVLAILLLIPVALVMGMNFQGIIVYVSHMADSSSGDITQRFAVISNYSENAYISSIQVQGDKAYVLVKDELTGDGEMDILNVKDRARPEKIGSLNISRSDYVAVSGDHAFILQSPTSQNWTDGNKIVILNITDPLNPSAIRDYGPIYTDFESNDIQTVYVHNDLLLANTWNKIDMLNISNASFPVNVFSFEFNKTSIPCESCISGDILYISAGGQGVYIYNIKDPAHPALIDHIDTNGGWVYNIIVNNNRMYFIMASVYIYDVSDPSNPRKLGEYEPSSGLGYMVLNGNTLYAEFYNRDQSYDGTNPYVSGGLCAIDVRDPANPSLIGEYLTSEPLYWIASDGEYLFLTTSDQMTILKLK